MSHYIYDEVMHPQPFALASPLGSGLVPMPRITVVWVAIEWTTVAADEQSVSERSGKELVNGSR
jgi:hypothetical protein